MPNHAPFASITGIRPDPPTPVAMGWAASHDDGGAETRTAFGLVMDVLSAHLVMLQDHGVIDGAGFEALAKAFDTVHSSLAADGPHHALRPLMAELASRLDAFTPPELAGAATLGLAREEWLATVVRLAWRSTIDAVLASTIDLRAALIEMADAHIVTIMPAFAGNRAAQPTSLGHLLGGVIVPLRSATNRLAHARVAIDRSPLGAGSLAGEILALDRERQAELLGFAAPVGNTLDAVMSVEDIVQAAEAIAASVAPVRRFLRELGAWLRADPDSFLLADVWEVQAEDTNPLIAIPEPIEQLIQQLAAVEDDCRTLVSRLRELPYGPVGVFADTAMAAAFALRIGTVEALTSARSLLHDGMTVNRAYLGNRSGRAYTTGGDLAAFLMTEEGLPPTAARAIAAMVLRQLREQRLEVSGIQQDMIDSAAMLTIGREIKVEMETLGRYLAPRRFLERRAALGTPATASAREWLASERSDLDADREASERERARGSAAIAALRAAIAAAESED